jgi:DNA-binding CsgD family transcriptional regulator
MRVDSAEASLAAGRDALASGEWEAARKAFELAVAAAETPEASEGLAEACWWLNDETGTFEAREKAFQLYRGLDDRQGAARMAIWLAIDSVDFRGQPAVANGWLQRARRLLQGLEDSPERGWLSLWEGHLALMLYNDTDTARTLGAEAAAAGRTLGLIDLEMLALALGGLALVSEGQIAEGMKRLDEAATAAVTGEMMDVNAMATALCYLIDACDRVRDFDRAVQWCARAKDFMEKKRCTEFFTFCRPHYAVVLMWRGQWEQAEAQLLAANREAPLIRPPMVAEGIVRLAELRWRQGRWEEADELFRQVEGEGLAQLGRAELALSGGDAAFAGDLAERRLRQIPLADRLERAPALELLVRAAATAGNVEAAKMAVDELTNIAAGVRTRLLRASASVGAGALAAAAMDYDGARTRFEDAIDLLEKEGAPFDAARARLELARTLLALGRRSTAGREATLALQGFRRVGAAKEAELAAAFLQSLGQETHDAKAGPSNPLGLSRREIEVLALIAAGKSNQHIAEALFLSVRTVERHISTIYEKIGVHGRSARAAATAYALNNGLLDAP